MSVKAKIQQDRAKLKLAELRQKIDAIDKQILTLLQKRIRLALRANPIKEKAELAVRDFSREAAILENKMHEAARKNLPALEIKAIFQKIIGVCRRAQMSARKSPTVGKRPRFGATKATKATKTEK